MRKGKDNILITLFKNPIQNIKRINLGEIPKAILDTMDILYEGKVNRPLLVKSKDKNKPNPSQYENGWHFVFTLNPGCSYEEVLSNKNYFKSVVAGNVEFKKVDKFLHIDVNTFQFADEYKFIIPDVNEIRKKYKDYLTPIPIGIKRGGKLLVVDLSAIPHIIVSGVTRYGKSTWLRQMMLWLAIAFPKTFLMLIDFKKVDAEPLKKIAMVATDINTAEQFLNALIKETERRLDILTKAQCFKIQDLPSSVYLPSIVIAIDELTRMDDESCQKKLKYLTTMSGATGISVIASLQRPSHTTYKNFTDSRSQFEARLCFRMSEPKDSNMVIGNSMAYDLIPSNKEGKGRAIWNWGDYEEVKGMYISNTEILQLLEQCENKKSFNSKEVIPFVEQIKEQKFWYLPR